MKPLCKVIIDDGCQFSKSKKQKLERDLARVLSPHLRDAIIQDAALKLFKNPFSCKSPPAIQIQRDIVNELFYRDVLHEPLPGEKSK